MFDLSGKMALVTRASGGIGGAIARGLHAQGAHVVLSGTREEALKAVQGELGARTSVVTADLSSFAQLDVLIAMLEANAGEMRILVANAGVTKVGFRGSRPGEDIVS